jgi:SAM-dependent methyltransferase
MKEMYEGELYAEKNPTWHEEDAPWKAAHVERMIKRNKLPHGRICEVGCGTGEILLSLEKAFPTSNLSGYEISPVAFGRAAAKETSHTKFYLQDLLAESGLNFDLVLAIDVIEHVEDYITFIKKLRSFGTVCAIHFARMANLGTQTQRGAHPLFLQAVSTRDPRGLWVHHCRSLLHSQPSRVAKPGIDQSDDAIAPSTDVYA